MILMFLMQFGIELLFVVLGGFEILKVSSDIISTLAEITSVASYVVGEDLLISIFASFAWWYLIRFAMAIFQLFMRFK